MVMEIKRIHKGVDYIYNLGAAHGQPRAENVETFQLRIANLKPTADAICCFTNGNQVVEREYLNKLGFTPLKYKNTYMMFHTISRERFERNFTDEFKEKIRLIEEERKKKFAVYLERYCADGRKEGELREGDIITDRNYASGEDGFCVHAPSNVSLYRLEKMNVDGSFSIRQVMYDSYSGYRNYGSPFGKYNSTHFTRPIWKKEEYNPK